MGITANVSGGEKLKKLIDEMVGHRMPSVKVGVQEGATSGDGDPIAPRAFYNEFGTVNIPARPAFRQTVQAREGEWCRAFLAYLKGRLRESGAVFNAGRLLGTLMAKDIQRTILDGGDFAPLDPKTVKAKQARIDGHKGRHGKGTAATPLIDTGDYVKAIEAVVE